MKIGVIGGGAAGFFAAIAAKESNPQASVVIMEKSSKFLAKVKVSGGGRCNVTNACFDIRQLSSHYPRGEYFLRKALSVFDARSTMDWFEQRGIKLRTYPDGCVFPQSNDSQTIIDLFYRECAEKGVELKSGFPVNKVNVLSTGFDVSSTSETIYFDKLIITIGGQPKRLGFNWLEQLNLEIIDPVPSLFTFNMPENPIRELMGNVTEQTTVRIEGSKLTGRGPLLITHWGMSGPAVLQLSAWGARELYEKQYNFSILVNWLDQMKEDEVRVFLEKQKATFPDRRLVNQKPFTMTNRLWCFLLSKIEVPEQLTWKELSGKTKNRLVNTLINDRYEVRGKTTFKEEFVTAGGISLTEIDVRTMQSKKITGLYFSGEVLDIDGITGGFNFQAAWTTGFIAGRSAAELTV
jgi:predicted Rossmann fold flavoprotein